MVYLEQTVGCCRPLVQCGGYVPVRDKDLVHAYLQCGNGADRSSCCSSVLAGAAYAAEAVHHAFVFVWQIFAHVMIAVGKDSLL